LVKGCGVWSRVVVFGQGLGYLVKGSDGFGQILWWVSVDIFINSNIHLTALQIKQQRVYKLKQLQTFVDCCTA